MRGPGEASGASWDSKADFRVHEFCTLGRSDDSQVGPGRPLEYEEGPKASQRSCRLTALMAGTEANPSFRRLSC
jgi:hypothetical protein